MQALTGSPIIRAWLPPSISHADLPILVSGHSMQLSVLDQHEDLTLPRLQLTHEDWVGIRFATDHRVCAARAVDARTFSSSAFPTGARR